MLDVDIKNVPNLIISQNSLTQPTQYDLKEKFCFRYRSKIDKELPHIVKFSGGRSSGMLLFTLLHNGILDRARGDVILFNNTSAEHPETYRFVADCMRASRQYGIPFFQIEFQTYEDSRHGEWTRLPTYRLVNDRPKSATNPEGFQWRGEAFEEMLSWTGYVPNQFNRICTRFLKLEVTRAFLRDWFSPKSVIPRLGHFGNGSRIDGDSAHDRHKRNQGGVPKEIFMAKRLFLWSRPHFRPEQEYHRFCQNYEPFENPRHVGKVFGDRAVFGRNGVQYVSFIGLRGDEQPRVERLAIRNDKTPGHEGEKIYLPLANMLVAKKDVNDFWDSQDWNLNLSNELSLSNCVYCFLKGRKNLQKIHNYMKSSAGEIKGFGSIKNTPSDLSWWKNIESKYRRDLKAEGRKTRGSIDRIGFFGNKGLAYKDLEKETNADHLTETWLPCDCTE